MKLAKELHDRNLVYTKVSMGIINNYKEVLDAVFSDMVDSKMTMKWNSIDFHHGNRLLLNIMGIASYASGQEIETEIGTTVYVDESNVREYDRLMRLILPTRPLSEGDIPSLIQFLKDYSSLIDYMTQDEIESGMSNPQFLADNFTIFADAFKDVEFVDRTRLHHDEFDLTELELDESQLMQLKITGTEGQA